MPDAADCRPGRQYEEDEQEIFVQQCGSVDGEENAAAKIFSEDIEVAASTSGS